MATPDPAPATSNISVRRGDPLVVITGVQKHYGDFQALKDIDLTVHRGEVIFHGICSGCEARQSLASNAS